jgi:hypothetical protein
MAYNDPAIVTADIKAIASLAGADLSVFIDMAVVYIDEYLLDKGLSDGILRLIAKNIAAHFAFLKEGQLKSETIGPISETFNMITGLGLNSTTFGQQAIFLDSSKTLAKLNDPNRVISKPVFESL